jgi:hypothetical protein
MNPTYSIQKPCTEDWGKMSPESAEKANRHCQVCCKTVIDFSKKSDTEIVDFLKTNAEKKICGRFRSEQLTPPAGSRAPKKNSRYRIFFAALFFVFGGMLFTSCSSTRGTDPFGGELMGDVAYVPDTTERVLMDDTVLVLPTDTTKKTGKNNPKCNVPDENIPAYKMGDIAFDPNDTLR